MTALAETLNSGAVNKSNLDRIIREAEELVLVQFWSPMSVSCTAMNSLLENLNEDPSVPFRLVRVKMERNLGLPNAYGVLTVPTLLIFNRGELQHQIIGLPSEPELRAKLERAWLQPQRNAPGGQPR